MQVPVLPDSMSEAIISTDAGLKIKSWNRAAEELYGLRKEEVMGQSLPAMTCFAFVNESFPGFIDQLNRTSQWKGDLLYISREGILKCIQSSVNAVPDEAGNIIGYVMVNRDELLPGDQHTGLRGIFDPLFQCVGLVNGEAAGSWSVILHWHDCK